MIIYNVYDGSRRLGSFADKHIAEWFSKEFGRVWDNDLHIETQGQTF